MLIEQRESAGTWWIYVPAGLFRWRERPVPLASASEPLSFCARSCRSFASTYIHWTLVSRGQPCYWITLNESLTKTYQDNSTPQLQVFGQQRSRHNLAHNILHCFPFAARTALQTETTCCRTKKGQVSVFPKVRDYQGWLLTTKNLIEAVAIIWRLRAITRSKKNL